MEEAVKDFIDLRKRPIKNNLSDIGQKAVACISYEQRLKANRKGRESPHDMLLRRRAYLEKKAKQLKQSVRHILASYAGMVGSFRPVSARYIIDKYQPHTVLDFSAGWGGRMVASLSLDVNYIGVDSNVDLEPGYTSFLSAVKDHTTAKAEMYYQPAETVDFSLLVYYDMIFTSPPYGDLEVYPGSPVYTDFMGEFLLPVVSKAWASLEPGGHMCLNMPGHMYERVKAVYGECLEVIECPIRSRTHKTKTEPVYVWRKAQVSYI